MPPAGLNVVKRSGKYVYLNAHCKKTQPSCPGSRDLNWTGKGLNNGIVITRLALCSVPVGMVVNYGETCGLAVSVYRGVCRLYL
jgi:hypothetical protein